MPASRLALRGLTLACPFFAEGGYLGLLLVIAVEHVRLGGGVQQSPEWRRCSTAAHILRRGVRKTGANGCRKSSLAGCTQCGVAAAPEGGHAVP